MRFLILLGVWRGEKMGKKITDPGWGAVFQCYTLHNFRRSVVWPLIIAILVVVFTMSSTVSPTILIDAVTTISLTIAPTVLGFTLAGYALMMGMSGSKVMQPIMDGEKPTLFQKLNSTFAIVLGASFITTLFCVFVKVSMSFVSQLSALNYNLKICIKAFTLFILVFLLIYTIFSIRDITINIFNFGQFAQTYHDAHPDDERAAGDIIVIKESVLMRFLDYFKKKSK